MLKKLDPQYDLCPDCRQLYTDCAEFMAQPQSFYFTAAIWGIALLGIAIKLLWIDAPRLLGHGFVFDFGLGHCCGF